MCNTACASSNEQCNRDKDIGTSMQPTTYIVLSGCRLQHSGEEAGGKGEPREPEQDGRVGGGGPGVDLVHPLDQVPCPCP